MPCALVGCGIFDLQRSQAPDSGHHPGAGSWELTCENEEKPTTSCLIPPQVPMTTRIRCRYKNGQLPKAVIAGGHRALIHLTNPPQPRQFTVLTTVVVEAVNWRSNRLRARPFNTLHQDPRLAFSPPTNGWASRAGSPLTGPLFALAQQARLHLRLPAQLGTSQHSPL